MWAATDAERSLGVDGRVPEDRTASAAVDAAAITAAFLSVGPSLPPNAASNCLVVATMPATASVYIVGERRASAGLVGRVGGAPFTASTSKVTPPTSRRMSMARKKGERGGGGVPGGGDRFLANSAGEQGRRSVRSG